MLTQTSSMFQQDLGQSSAWHWHVWTGRRLAFAKRFGKQSLMEHAGP